VSATPLSSVPRCLFSFWSASAYEYVLLTSPPADGTTNEEEEMSLVHNHKDKERVLVTELPLDYQVFRLIDDCGQKGITQTVHSIHTMLPHLGCQQSKTNRRWVSSWDWEPNTAATGAGIWPSTTVLLPLQKTLDAKSSIG